MLGAATVGRGGVGATNMVVVDATLELFLLLLGPVMLVEPPTTASVTRFRYGLTTFSGRVTVATGQPRACVGASTAARGADPFRGSF